MLLGRQEGMQAACHDGEETLTMMANKTDVPLDTMPHLDGQVMDGFQLNMVKRPKIIS